MNKPHPLPGQGQGPLDTDLPTSQNATDTPAEKPLSPPKQDDSEGPHDDAGNPIQKL